MAWLVGAMVTVVGEVAVHQHSTARWCIPGGSEEAAGASGHRHVMIAVHIHSTRNNPSPADNMGLAGHWKEAGDADHAAIFGFLLVVH